MYLLVDKSDKNGWDCFLAWSTVCCAVIQWRKGEAINKVCPHVLCKLKRWAWFLDGCYCYCWYPECHCLAVWTVDWSKSVTSVCYLCHLLLIGWWQDSYYRDWFLLYSNSIIWLHGFLTAKPCFLLNFIIYIIHNFCKTYCKKIFSSYAMQLHNWALHSSFKKMSQILGH